MRILIIPILLALTYPLKAQTMKDPKEVVYELFKATDEPNWEIVANVFDKEIILDYSAMTGKPAQKTNPEAIIKSWKAVLPGFTTTHHQLGNVSEERHQNKAHVFAYGTATHYFDHEDGSVWTVVGTYDFDLVIVQGEWKIRKMKFNYKYQSGNTNLVKQAIKNIKQEHMKKVTFKSEGLDIVGNLYYPSDYEDGKTYPAIVVSGSWTTVKEQMAGLYAARFAEQGFIALAFDFRNFGESEGEPRFFESPQLKKVDIINAVTYLEELPEVASSKIGAFGVCAGAMYTVMASAEDGRIKSVVTAASWLHDEEAVKLFYGGEAGVQAKIRAAKAAKELYATSGEVSYIPAISETDESAAMFGPYDYYLNPDRGAISQWSNDKFAVASWEDWLTANPMSAAQGINQPILMIHSDGAVLPDYTKAFFSNINTKDKKLHWMETNLDSPFHQFSYYDQEAEVKEVIQEASQWFSQKM